MELMTAKRADAETLKEICRLAADVKRVRFSRAAQYDMAAHHLTEADVRGKIIDWIGRGEPVKEVTIHSIPNLVGHSAYEIKPRMRNMLFYIKVALIELGRPGEHMLVISTHPDH